MIKIIENAVKDLYELEGFEIDIVRNDEARFGVYTTNVAFLIAQKIKQSVEEVAEEIVRRIKEEEHIFIPSNEKGHINLYLPKEVHLGHYAEIEGDVSEL